MHQVGFSLYDEYWVLMESVLRLDTDIGLTTYIYTLKFY